jgi:hypothetical protein
VVAERLAVMSSKLLSVALPFSRSHLSCKLARLFHRTGRLRAPPEKHQRVVLFYIATKAPALHL